MPQYEYDIILNANISIGGKFTAATRDEAIEAAKLELRGQGEISEISVDRCVFLDEQEFLERESSDSEPALFRRLDTKV